MLFAGALALPADALRRETLKLHTASGVHVLNIEVAETMGEKKRGLMYRKHLPANAGMLFVFDRPREIGMWMRSTYIPLDIVFIRADGTVHRIEAQAEPLSERDILSGGDVIACLEIAGGAAERLQLKPGDRVEHPAFKRRR
jgi:uncharacterized membrane protein (UPF0127 family)